jgi:hypothetical protein
MGESSNSNRHKLQKKIAVYCIQSIGRSIVETNTRHAMPCFYLKNPERARDRELEEGVPYIFSEQLTLV